MVESFLNLCINLYQLTPFQNHLCFVLSSRLHETISRHVKIKMGLDTCHDMVRPNLFLPPKIYLYIFKLFYFNVLKIKKKI